MMGEIRGFIKNKTDKFGEVSLYWLLVIGAVEENLILAENYEFLFKYTKNELPLRYSKGNVK